MSSSRKGELHSKLAKHYKVDLKDEFLSNADVVVYHWLRSHESERENALPYLLHLGYRSAEENNNRGAIYYCDELISLYTTLSRKSSYITLEDVKRVGMILGTSYRKVGNIRMALITFLDCLNFVNHTPNKSEILHLFDKHYNSQPLYTKFLHSLKISKKYGAK